MMEVLFQSRKHVIEQSLQLYGRLPLLVFLQELEEQENYELCAVIKEVVGEGRYSEEEVQSFRNSIRQITGTNGDMAIHNIPSYIRTIKGYLKQLEK